MTLLGEPRNENYRSWIRKNSELTEFFRIQLQIVVYFILPLALLVRKHFVQFHVSASHK